MKNIFGLTIKLSQALKRKDQDIVNVINLVETLKQTLQMMRDSGWETLQNQVCSFCLNYDINVPNIDYKFFYSRAIATQDLRYHKCVMVPHWNILQCPRYVNSKVE